MNLRRDTTSSQCTVRILSGNGPAILADRHFADRFVIGRTEDNDVCVKNEYVSRRHVEVLIENGSWIARDLNSSNGMFVNGVQVAEVAVSNTVIRLGVAGPEISLAIEAPKSWTRPDVVASPAVGDQTMVAQYIDRYFKSGDADEAVGEHTMYVRRAFKQVHKKERSKYWWMLAALGVCILGLAGYAFYEHQQLSKQRALAEDVFYSMKTVDVEIVNLQRLLLNSPSLAGSQEVRSFQNKREAMEKSYNQFLGSMNVYDPKLSDQDRLILRVTRIFGECELNMPTDFISEVKKYIERWKATGRLQQGIATANANGYTKVIAKQFLDNDLPPQFFYLALQESGFDQYVSGPVTAKGIAKGMWQFIPETAIKYGLHLGPLVDMRRADPGDDRHHYDRETKAAVQYIKDLYGTDAQASGLLVMACYNWGEGHVVPLVRQLPENPRDRNFWKLLAQYHDKLPQETYDYVFYILSAAAIGENPRAFGFSFDDPLADISK